jgi:NAD(P)H dehydrogenase (quinone)
MIVVTGASGNLGRKIVEELITRVDAAGVTAVSRTPEKIADLRVRTRQAGFGDLEGALDGAERLLLMGLPQSPDRLHLHHEAIRAAVRAGVGHIVYASVTRAAEPGNPVGVVADHGATERLLAQAGVPFTALRFNTWPEVLLMIGIARLSVATGVLLSNSGDGRTGYVTRDDSAAAAAALLAEGGHQGQLLEITGPAALTDEDLAETLAEATGRPVAHRAVDDSDMPKALVEQGFAEPLAAAWTAHGPARRAGWFDVTTHAFQRLTGRPPVSAGEFFAAHRTALLEE